MDYDSIAINKEQAMMFNNNQQVATSAKQIEGELSRAKKVLFDKGDSMPLVALAGAYVGNKTVEFAVEEIYKQYRADQYNKWISGASEGQL